MPMYKKALEKAERKKKAKAPVKKTVKEPLLLTGAITVEDKLDRKVLGEGRNYQMGFGFCKKVAEGKFETVQPLSPCKDYLNDVVYTEHTKKDFNACGLKTTYQGIFVDQPSAYIAIKILPSHSGSKYANMDNDIANLKKNYKNIEVLLNSVEEALKIDGRTKIQVASNDDKMYLLSLPHYWCEGTARISLYSLLVRMAQFWDGTGSPELYLKNYNNPLDMALWKTSNRIENKYNTILKYGFRLTTPMELYDMSPTSPNVHSNGIAAYH